MRLAKLSVGPVLWLAGWCLLAAGETSGQEDPRQPCSPQLGSENCPRPTKSAPLVTSFTKTPTPPSKHTTTHHHRRHTTVPANHTTSHPATTTTPKKPTTTHHATTAPANHTSASHHTSATHTSASHQTSHPTTTASANHTSASHNTTAAHHTTAAHNTTAAHTTAAPRPTQPPSVLVGNYTVKQGASICLRAEMGLKMQIQYADQAKRQVWGAFAVQPNHTNFSGTCSDKTATLKLHFPEGFILFTFEKNATEKAVYLRQVEANLTYQFPQATEKTFRANNASLREFAAPLGKSYQCRNRSLALSENFRLTALSERVQAFQLQDGKFGEAEVCSEQKRSVVLPIVVGVVLGVLILIVLVAFAVGRWRARTGYESL
ncbi:macrosialin [Pantherophis guttatus]|uniref:Macrosialin n=1 Tax=Pantherophis guttatus TaxID=94885 RepID=A0A6P9AWJ0_PANGU|nr:macrosialin [Pantherophis guttatus]XP_060540711.1 macrosialin [Pantherophis guttatus]